MNFSPELCTFLSSLVFVQSMKYFLDLTDFSGSGYKAHSGRDEPFSKLVWTDSI